MALAITFLEGIVTFISPCLLPMLPLYLAYFAGTAALPAAGGTASRSTRRTMMGALGFALGFTCVFVGLGALAGTFGAQLARHQTALNVICGAIIVLFGLSISGLVRIPLLERTLKPRISPATGSFWSAVVFGVTFAIGWTPCVGAYLGSALMLASTQGSTLAGVGLLLAYSAGLAIPFVLCAALADGIMGALEGIKRHTQVISLVCGLLLVAMGMLTMTGLMGSWLGQLSILGWEAS